MKYGLLGIATEASVAGSLQLYPPSGFVMGRQDEDAQVDWD
jgi:hypothetical protein